MPSAFGWLSGGGTGSVSAGLVTNGDLSYVQITVSGGSGLGVGRVGDVGVGAYGGVSNTAPSLGVSPWELSGYVEVGSVEGLGANGSLNVDPSSLSLNIQNLKINGGGLRFDIGAGDYIFAAPVYTKTWTTPAPLLTMPITTPAYLTAAMNP